MTRPRLADVGLHTLTGSIVLFQLCLAGALVALLPVVGLTILWRTGLPLLIIDATFLAAWLYLWRVPGRPKEWIVAEAVLVLLLIVVTMQILSPAQYVAGAFRRPLIDQYLASADALMGVHVPSLAQWSREHPRINLVLAVAYLSFLPQLVLAPPIVGVLLRDRKALWEYAFHFHACATITVVCLGLFPAACAFQYYGFESTLNQARFIAHFNGLRDGSLTVVEYRNLEGLISMPSFHMAGALMVLWSFRRHRRFLRPLAVLNTLLMLGTVMTGAHYAVDLLGTAAMFLVSILAWRVLGERLLEWTITPRHAAAAQESS